MKYISINCPYCKKVTSLKIENYENHYKTLVCDVDVGGCDKPYTVFLEIIINPILFKLGKIEQ